MASISTDFRKNITVVELKLRRLMNEYQTEYNRTHEKYYCTKNYQKEVERYLLIIKTMINKIEKKRIAEKE